LDTDFKYLQAASRIRLSEQPNTQRTPKRLYADGLTEKYRGLRGTRQNLPTLIQDELEFRPFTEEPPVAPRSFSKYTPLAGWQCPNRELLARADPAS
jgi:hypothetical protein